MVSESLAESVRTQPPMFPQAPTLRFYDPLARLLGAGDGVYAYTFDDAVKLAGHACPTVAGAFLLVRRAMRLLHGDDMPLRGDIGVTVHGSVDEGVNGPMSQIFSLVTGATKEDGFQGLAGYHVRKGLLRFAPRAGGGGTRVTFERRSTGERVTLAYDPSAFPPPPTQGQDLQAVLGGTADASVQQRFRDTWRGRVERILADDGACTVSVVDEPVAAEG